MRGIEAEFLQRMASTTLETKRSIQLSAALMVGVGVLLAGITIGVLLNF